MRGNQRENPISRRGLSFYATLAIAQPQRLGKVVLARVTQGIRLCRECDYQELPAHQACECIHNLGSKEMPGLRAFLAHEKLVGLPLPSLGDQELLSLLGRLLRTQELVVLLEGKATAGLDDASLAEQRRLVRDIERRTRARLQDSGRSYKLVADGDLARLVDRDRYEVVGNHTAARVLDAIAKQNQADSLVRDLLAQAREKLAPDWRRPFLPEGLVLLRRIVDQRATSPSSESPISPSQYAKLLKKKTWIEIEVVYKDGTPYAGPCLLKQPDASTTTGFLGPSGFWGAHEIDEGTYTFTVRSAAAAAAAEEGPDETGDAPVVRRVRLVGMVFDANKCFLLPQALSGLKTILAMHEEDPAAEMLIVGHAGGDEDLAGADIALDRARILGAYLKSQPNLWLNWFGPDKSPRSRWGTREIQLMLSALPEGETPFYDGFASGHTDEKTVEAIKAFQNHAGLSSSGTADFPTRKALVEAYMAIEDTTLADDITPVAHGCEGHVDDTATASGAQSDDRRLDVFFFKEGIDPKPDQTVTSAQSTLYPSWLAKVVETRDFETHGIHVQIIDSVKQPCPFATVHLDGPITADATTDAYGYVSFFGLKQGEYTLSSEKNGYAIGISKLSYPTAQTVPGCGKSQQQP